MRQQYRNTILAGLLAAIWIVTPLLSAVHIALDVHTYCAEHGTLEEGVTHHGLPDEAPQGDADAEAHAPAGGLPNTLGHTACAFGDPATRDSFHFAHTPTIGSAPAAVDTNVFVAWHHDGPSQPPLVAAPKTSPPAHV